MAISALMSLSLGASFNALAQDAQYLNSDPIDINGYVQAEVDPTDQELENVRGQLNFAKKQSTLNKVKAKNYQKLATETEKLSETSEELIRERAQAQRDVKNYQKKIDCLMGRISGSKCDGYKVPVKDHVRTGRAAPIVSQKIVTKKHSGDNFGETIKILPYSGFSTFISENEQLEAGLNAGLQIESNVSKRFAVGIGVQYSSLTTNDFAGSLNSFDIGRINNFGFNGREIKYTNLNFDIYGKFYLFNSERFRPYVGAGVGYNRSKLKYDDDINFNNGFDFQQGDEGVTSSSVSGELFVGSEVAFTQTFGMQLELNYKRGLGGNLSNENNQFNFFAPDQQRLEDLSNELQEANVISLYAAMQIKF